MDFHYSSALSNVFNHPFILFFSYFTILLPKIFINNKNKHDYDYDYDDKKQISDFME
jgi:uncharacterized membrane protein